METQSKKQTEQIQTNNKWIEKFLCLIIILCPILDCASFIFRNFFQTTISVSTIIRPIIPLCLLLYIFIKGSKKEKIVLVLIALAYIGYAAVHLLIYNSFHNGCAYGDIKLEMQYVFNFSFVMIYFIVFAFLFLKKDLATDKLYNSITIMATIYIASIVLAITGEVGNMTGDMLRIKNKILNNTLEEGYMSEAQKQSVLDLYEYTKSVNLAGTDTRTQQLMYNLYLMKNQGSFTGIVFGNGYNNNVREMRMENELASLFLNFGLCGFILYACPVLAVLIYAIVFGIKKRKDITLNYVMNVAALILAIGLSWLSGYVLFATSSMTVIVVIATLLLVEIKKIKKKEKI